MNKIVILMMYLMWIATIVAILTTTFTSFQYEDLNIITICLLIFSMLNSFLVATRNK